LGGAERRLFSTSLGYHPGMDNAYSFLGIVIAWVCILLFWLGVNVVDGWVQRNVYPPIRLWWARLVASACEKLARRKAAGATDHLGDAPRIGK
jgi:hypothetical protein